MKIQLWFYFGLKICNVKGSLHNQILDKISVYREEIGESMRKEATLEQWRTLYETATRIWAAL